MPTDKKKSPNKKDKNSTARMRGVTPSGTGYGKKTALLEEAITHMNAGRYGRSAAALKELLAMDPHNMEARRLFATLHLRLGSLIPARQAFDSLIDEAFARQDYWLAESLLREYLEAGPRCVPYLEKLGAIYRDKGQILEAVAEYGKAIDILIEDPDPDDPNHASRLFEQIKSLAPACPVAIRLAACFDAQTGELIARPADTSETEILPTEEGPGEPGVPMDSGVIDAATPWEQVEHSSLAQESDVPSPSEPIAGPDSESQIKHSALTKDFATLSSSGMAAETSEPLHLEEEICGETVSFPGPATDMPDPAMMHGRDEVCYKSEPALNGSDDTAVLASHPSDGLADGLDRPAQDAALLGTDTVSWQTAAETTEVVEFVSVPDQSPVDASSETLKRGAGSEDTVLEHAWEAGSAPPADAPTSEPPQNGPIFIAEQTVSAMEDSVSAPAVEPGVDIALSEADRASSEQETAVAPSSGAPMPWDHVQDSTIEIPAAQSDGSLAESTVTQVTDVSRQAEPVVPWSPSEPGYEQDSAPAVAPTAGDTTDLPVFSIRQSSPLPPTVHADSAPADVPQAYSSAGDQTSGAAVEEPPAEFFFAGESPTPVGPEVPDPVERVPEIDRSAPSSTESEDRSVPSSAGSVKPEPQSRDTMRELAAQRRIGQEEWSEPAGAEEMASAPPSSPRAEERTTTGGSAQFVGESDDRSSAETVLRRFRWGKQKEDGSASTVAAAVDALFEPAGSLMDAETETREHTERQRPKQEELLNRIGRTASDCIRSCFSTTRAIVMSVGALMVFVCAVAALGAGAVGLTWVIMEESPSVAYQHFTARSSQTLSDPKNNGYLVLLGFDAPSGQDPVQAGSALNADGQDADRVMACLGGSEGSANTEHSNASAKVLSGWVRGSDPLGNFMSNQGALSGWISRGEAMLERYRRWQQLPFEDWGYGQAVAPPCASIAFAHHLYIAEGFVRQTDVGVERLEADMEAWRVVLAQAKTLPVKMLAIQAVRDNAAVASGILARSDFDGKHIGRLSRMLRPLSQAELSIRWPMQSELVQAAKTFDARLKAERGDEQSLYAVVVSSLPLPKQRRLNRYAAYYEASFKAAEEGRHLALPQRGGFLPYPAETMMDYLANPIENVIGLDPLPRWDLYHGIVVDADAHLRLASLQAWIRRGLPDAELLPRIAKAGQNFYDPYTGLPMLVNLKKRVLYSVGHDGKDQDGDPQYDVVVSIPADQTSGLPKSSSAPSKSG